MTELEQNLQRILSEKENKILPQNIKEGVQIYDVIGTLREGIDTSDATASADDLSDRVSAYVNGHKIQGNLSDTNHGGMEYWYDKQGTISGKFETKGVELVNNRYVGIKTGFRDGISYGIIIRPGDESLACVTNKTMADALHLTPEKIVEGNTILDVQGTGGSIEREAEILELLEEINGEIV